MNANELRKIALEQQELEYLKHYNDTLYRLDKVIEWRAKECGWTSIYLIRGEGFYATDNHAFWYIDRKMSKDLKKYYQKRGFKFSKNFFNKSIRIAW